LVVERLLPGSADQPPELSLGISVVALALVVISGRVLETRIASLRRVERSEALNRLTLENVSDAVFITNEEGALTHVWPAVARFFGLEPKRSEGQLHVRDLLGHIDLRHPDLQSRGEVTNLDVAVAGKANGQRRLLVTVKRVDIGDGRLLFTCRDVTQLSSVESELETALEELRALKDRFEAEALYLKEELRTDHNVEGIIGSSPRLQEMLGELETVAQTDSTVLIRGETGSGKELVARALHALSARSDRPLVKVNCAALPASLVETELFGHEKGAFTGAAGRKIGRFELADGGTLFLDEVGEMPAELQPKLLRALQEGEFERVGGTETISVDVRLLAATNRDLKAEVEAGRFRSDLYFRLNVFPIVVPSLRERPEDLLLLASHFLQDIGVNLGRSYDGFTPASVEGMARYPWPGNVRELKNVVERAAIVAPGGRVNLVPYLGEAEGSSVSAPHASRRLVDVESAHIRDVLDATDWTIEGDQGAAAVLDMQPSTLRSRMKKLGIRRPSS
jgi:PAS domain S-box-containing protein